MFYFSFKIIAIEYMTLMACSLSCIFVFFLMHDEICMVCTFCIMENIAHAWMRNKKTYSIVR